MIPHDDRTIDSNNILYASQLIEAAIQPAESDLSIPAFSSDANTNSRNRGSKRIGVSGGGNWVGDSLSESCSSSSTPRTRLELSVNELEERSMLQLNSEISLLACVGGVQLRESEGKGVGTRDVHPHLFMDTNSPTQIGSRSFRGMGIVAEKTLPSSRESTGNKSYMDSNLRDLWRVAQTEFIRERANDALRPHSALDKGSQLPLDHVHFITQHISCGLYSQIILYFSLTKLTYLLSLSLCLSLSFYLSFSLSFSFSLSLLLSISLSKFLSLSLL